MSDDKILWTGVEQLSKHIKIVDAENGGRVVVVKGIEQKMSDYREIIVKEYHNEKGLLTRREIGEEIVRCKDCEFWDKDESVLNGGICDEWSDFEDSIIRYTNPDDYCSKGEAGDV